MSKDVLRIQIILVLVFILSRYWSKSIIRVPPAPKIEMSTILVIIFRIIWRIWINIIILAEIFLIIFWIFFKNSQILRKCLKIEKLMFFVRKFSIKIHHFWLPWGKHRQKFKKWILTTFSIRLQVKSTFSQKEEFSLKIFHSFPFSVIIFWKVGSLEAHVM